MPKLANRPHRPWTSKPVDYNKIPGQGRYHVNKFYQSRAWKAFTRDFLAEHRLCVMCDKAGILKFANTTDHIKPINPKDAYDTQNGRYGEPLDKKNCQALCSRCHNKKSAMERHGKTLRNM